MQWDKLAFGAFSFILEKQKKTGLVSVESLVTIFDLCSPIDVK